MLIQAHLYAFAVGQVREIDVPDAEMVGSVRERLEKVFYYGQNDFQPRNCPSLSVGDVVELDGRKWMVMSLGFEEISEDDLSKYLGLTRLERPLYALRMSHGGKLAKGQIGKGMIET